VITDKQGSPQSINVNDDLLHNVHSVLERTLREHVEEMAFVGDNDLFPAVVDPVQLESALLNLCLDARDAMSGAAS